MLKFLHKNGLVKIKVMKLKFEEFKQKFSEAIEDDSILILEPNSSFKDLESWDSFSGMAIISMIDEEFGMTIKADEMASINTLQELYILISNKFQ
jgi:acyl carrier protein